MPSSVAGTLIMTFFTADGGVQAARFFNRALRVFGQFRRNFEADEAGFAAGGFVFGKTYVASGLHIGNRHGFSSVVSGSGPAV